MICLLSAFLAFTTCASAAPQDRLEDMAKFDRYERLRRTLSKTVVRNDFPNLKWAEDGKTFTYVVDKKRHEFNLAEATSKPLPRQRDRETPYRRPPQRGRQYDTAFTADQSLKAFTKDRNVYISKPSGSGLIQVTTDGNAQKRTKYGIASWVYGEELGVREAMWWSPDGKLLAYYGFDESKVPDFYLTLDETKIHNRLDVEPYPKAGDPNPVVDLYVYDLATKKTVKIDVRFDSGAGADLGHYIYNVKWSPDGTELLFNRTNRKQCTMEFVAANLASGKCRVIVRETHPETWTENSPGLWWIEDGKGKKDRFIWISERNGFRNLYLVKLDGKSIKPLTQHLFDIGTVQAIDKNNGVVFYTARSGKNPYMVQLHRVGLDGKGEKRLTDPAFSHSCSINPDCTSIVDTYETLETPPASQELDPDGKVVKELSKADRSAFDKSGYSPVERLTFKAADGKTDLYGYLMKPKNFDPSKKYPLLVNLYSGPESGTGAERFTMPSGFTELGFLVAWFDGRGTSGRGKAFLDQIYGKLGIVEIDDQAAGVKYLRERPYVDGSKVGVTGTSYGGYASIMCILRYPDVFQAALACSSVTQWENYDTIYTERYMNTPQDNPEGYKAASSMNYAGNLKGRLMLFYGTMDNNVHPTNTHQLIAALNRAGKRYEVMVGPDQGHTGLDQTRTWAFFTEALQIGRAPDALKTSWNRMKSADRRLARK